MEAAEAGIFVNKSALPALASGHCNVAMPWQLRKRYVFARGSAGTGAP